MSHNRVPVFSIQAESENDAPLYWLTERAAEQMVQDGKAKRVSRIKHNLKIQLINLNRSSNQSPACITESEILINAGLLGDRNAYRNVIEKVKEYIGIRHKKISNKVQIGCAPRA